MAEITYASGKYTIRGAVAGDAVIGVRLVDGEETLLMMPEGWESNLRDTTRAAIWLTSLRLSGKEVEYFLIAECRGRDVWTPRVSYEQKTLTWMV